MTEYSDEDMAAVGRSLMEAIEANSEAWPLKGWSPTDCPSEVVGDLLNILFENVQYACAALKPFAQVAAGLSEDEWDDAEWVDGDDAPIQAGDFREAAYFIRRVEGRL